MLVAIVRVPAPPTPEAAAMLERRFAERLPQVAEARGYRGFELLRPSDGASHYLSISRWHSRADFDAWVASASNAQAHGRPASTGGAPPPSGPAPGAGGGMPGGVELYEVCDL